MANKFATILAETDIKKKDCLCINLDSVFFFYKYVIDLLKI